MDRLRKKLLDEIKHTVNKNTLLAYPYFNKWFGKNRNANQDFSLYNKAL